MPGVRGKKYDGRVLRGRRNREAVVEALLGLVANGDLNPTAEAIARRAGISRRSVFQHFADLESIYEAAGKRVGAALQPLLGPIDPTLPVMTRIEALAARRRSLFDTVDPIARAARVREPFSEQLRLSRQRLSLMMREQCRQAFAPELAELPTVAADETASALAGALSWSLWNHLRADLDLGSEEALAVMTRLVAGLVALPPSERAGLPLEGAVPR